MGDSEALFWTEPAHILPTGEEGGGDGTYFAGSWTWILSGFLTLSVCFTGSTENLASARESMSKMSGNFLLVMQATDMENASNEEIDALNLTE